jgi:hypothetical protein
MEGVSHPATPSGPPSDQHPPGSKPQPFHKERIRLEIPPQVAWPPKTASHILKLRQLCDNEQQTNNECCGEPPREPDLASLAGHLSNVARKR